MFIHPQMMHKKLNRITHRKSGRVGKGISARASHRTVLESLPSHGSSHSVEKELTTGLN